MELLLPIVLFISGIIALVWGGDRFVSAASWIAEKTGVPKFVIGATIVSIATTLPEMIVSVLATIDGNVDMAVGNAVGSVSANIGLIMGLSLLLLPSVLEDNAFWAKGILMISSTAFLGAFVIDARLNIAESIILLILLLVFFYLNLRSMKTDNAKTWGKHSYKKPCFREILYNIVAFILGISGIMLGARLLVDNGERIARIMGASEALIGLTFVAIGTSLPELITTLTAIAKKESSLSIGNILGANIIDITMILATCTFVSNGSLCINSQTAALDIPLALVLMGITVIPAIIKKQFYRWQGVMLLLVYGVYVAYLSLAM